MIYFIKYQKIIWLRKLIIYNIQGKGARITWQSHSEELVKLQKEWDVNGLSVCSHCGELIKSHTVCPKCGYYDGKQIIKK